MADTDVDLNSLKGASQLGVMIPNTAFIASNWQPEPLLTCGCGSRGRPVPSMPRTGGHNDGYAIFGRPISRGSMGSTLPTDTLIPGTYLPAPIVFAALDTQGSRRLDGHPLMIFDTPQVVNLTYPGTLAFEGKMLNNYPVNRTDFRLVRGVVNEIIFFVRDIDRKPVPLAAADSLTINIVDPLTETLLMSRDLTVFDLPKGIYQFQTLPSEMDTWPTGPLRWSISHNRETGGTVLLWTDLNYSPFSSLRVTDSPTPGPAPSKTLMPADFSQLLDGRYFSSALIGAAQNGYANGMQSFVIAMEDYSGTIQIDASLAAQPSTDEGDWFEVDYADYIEMTGNSVIDVQGSYLWLRMVITMDVGSVMKVTYKV